MTADPNCFTLLTERKHVALIMRINRPKYRFDSTSRSRGYATRGGGEEKRIFKLIVRRLKAPGLSLRESEFQSTPFLQVEIGDTWPYFYRQQLLSVFKNNGMTFRVIEKREG